MKKINIHYYAVLRENRGLNQESVRTSAKNAKELYNELKSKYNFPFNTSLLKVAINNAFAPWETELKDDDMVIFIPPVAGG